jgi:single-strand DNA-binding protein
MRLNKALIGGRLTKDPELRKTASGISVCDFTVAVNGYKKDDPAIFIDCTAFRGQAEFLTNYAKKGSTVVVGGKIDIQSYTDKENIKRKSFKIIADDVQLAEAKSSGTASGASDVTPFEQNEFAEDDLPF